MLNTSPRIGILIVTYNAVNTLAKVLKRIPAPVWDSIEEVAIFDDASQDATYELAIGLKTLSENTKVSVIRHAENLGYGGNQKAGYRFFINKGFDIVVLLHGDGQYAPEVLADLYQPIAAGRADAVFGSRMMKRFGGALKGGMPFYKYAGNRLLTAFENWSLGLELSEFHSGYRAYNLHALKQIDFSQMTNDFHFDTEIIIKLHHQRFRITEVPIPTYYGDEICYVNGMKYARNVVRAIHRYRQTRRSMARHPEFAEYFVHYPVKTGSHSSHAYLRECVSEGQFILDIGCGEGFLAKELCDRGNHIWGIDALPGPQHAEAFEGYVQADLDGVRDLPNLLGERKFGFVLLMDVLEHLRKPEKLLALCRGVLNQNGLVIVSIPNVANITVRLSLLFGRFSYAERGIMDRTHLRFFTRRTARQIMEDSGFEVLEEKMTVMPLEIVIGSPDKNPFIRLAHQFLRVCTRLLPGLFGYQIFFVARKLSA